ncbi:hypothetical protein V8G54_016964 [Vigna mungo]|uniref:Uncharacterized protein n=1 Tax=Vigna mungo TaxID=3915 RepID=A0AAQ3NL83_VIGMU
MINQTCVNGTNQIIMKGACRGKRFPPQLQHSAQDTPQGIQFSAILDLKIGGANGDISVLDDNKLKVEASDWAVLLLVASSSFSGPFTSLSSFLRSPLLTSHPSFFLLQDSAAQGFDDSAWPLQTKSGSQSHSALCNCKSKASSYPPPPHSTSSYPPHPSATPYHTTGSYPPVASTPSYPPVAYTDSYPPVASTASYPPPPTAYPPHPSHSSPYPQHSYPASSPYPPSSYPPPHSYPPASTYPPSSYPPPTGYTPGNYFSSPNSCPLLTHCYSALLFLPPYFLLVMFFSLITTNSIFFQEYTLHRHTDEDLPLLQPRRQRNNPIPALLVIRNPIKGIVPKSKGYNSPIPNSLKPHRPAHFLMTFVTDHIFQDRQQRRKPHALRVILK